MADVKDVKVEEVAVPSDMKIIKEMTYAIEVECEEADTRHFKHIWSKSQGGKLAQVPPILKEAKATIVNGFNKSVEKYAQKPCMGTRLITECLFDGKKQYWTKSDYQWSTYAEVARDVRAAASGITQLNTVKEKKVQGGMCVAAILAETSAEWQVSAQAAFQCGLTITTVYTTLGHDAMMHGINETEASVIFLDWSVYDTLKDKVIAKCPSLKHIVLIGKALVPLSCKNGEVAAFPSPEQAAALGTEGGITVTTLDALIAAGNKEQVALEQFEPQPEDVAFIMYTSGSTGTPKGVVLTHANFMGSLAGIIAIDCITPGPDDVLVAYLPLAHILELLVEVVCLCQGARIGYGHPRSLTSSSVCIHPDRPEGSDMLALRPTLMAAVPAIVDLIKNGLQMKLKSAPGRRGQLARAAVNQTLGLPAGEGALARCLVGCCLRKFTINKIRKQLGLENLRILVSGGAPLAPETQEYVTAVLAPIAQGYGATETCGIGSAQEVVTFSGRPIDRSTGGVGSIVPCTEVKLLSVQDMGYLVTDSPPRGEILISGHNVAARGYYKMEDKTMEDFPKHADGKVWFHTGDVGVMTEEGTLRIVDRKKDLIKLSGGEYVSLGKVEAGLKQVPGIGAVVVFAQSNKDHCVAIVSQPEKGWASVGGKPDEDTLVNAIAKKLKEMGFARFEVPTKVKVDETIWTPETGLVTASMKVQRNPLREHYNGEGGLLEAMDYKFASA